ncbi:uncharacterized protein LOC120270327 [Dioscorea cayenensis subsp. rotundata]|uniref:Uncharacterized protein LOC120270327 n=1 Tax=Dioscorea cayennensis subsp. rotundata TaxID=55577 RepID=A0AB40C1R8_DIOCR|nr:uncharacterized protein LOC120270327 [Dioscorea cayenensis subsp. rotundata]
MDYNLQVDLILQSLPDSFSQFIVNFNMNDIECTLAGPLNKLVSTQSQMKTKGKDVVALTISTSRPLKPKKKKMAKKQNALAPKAVEGVGQNKGKALVVCASESSKQASKCFHCGEADHWKRHCPQLIADGSTGRIVEMLDALEAMAEDTQPIPPRAMILGRKYRSFVSSWIEPMQEEADIGKEIGYIVRTVDEELDELISRIKLEDGNIEFWKSRFLGEGLNNVPNNQAEVEKSDSSDMLYDDGDEGEDASKETEDDEVDEEEEVEQQEEEVEQTENQAVDSIKDKEAQRLKPLQMIDMSSVVKGF